MVVRLANDLVHNVRVGKGVGQLAEVLDYFEVLSTNLKADNVPTDILSIECELDWDSLDQTGKFKTVCKSQSGDPVECVDFDDYGNCILVDESLAVGAARSWNGAGILSEFQRLFHAASDQLRSRLHQEFVVFRSRDFMRLRTVGPPPSSSPAMRGVRIVAGHFALARNESAHGWA